MYKSAGTARRGDMTVSTMILTPSITTLTTLHPTLSMTLHIFSTLPTAFLPHIWAKLFNLLVHFADGERINTHPSDERFISFPAPPPILILLRQTVSPRDNADRMEGG
jgi:hypothetical protein